MTLTLDPLVETCSDGYSCVGTFLSFWLMAKTDSFSKMLCFKGFKTVYNVQSNSHAYGNTPLSETFGLTISSSTTTTYIFVVMLSLLCKIVGNKVINWNVAILRQLRQERRLMLTCLEIRHTCLIHGHLLQGDLVLGLSQWV
jgi:hypothetical protein